MLRFVTVFVEIIWFVAGCIQGLAVQRCWVWNLNRTSPFSFVLFVLTLYGNASFFNDSVVACAVKLGLYI